MKKIKVFDPLVAFATTSPFEFNFLNAQSQPLLHLSNNTEGETMFLEVVNTSNLDYLLPSNEQGIVSEKLYHIEIRFRPGILDTKTKTRVSVKSKDWRITFYQNTDGTDSLYLNNVSAYNFQHRTSLTLEIQNLFVVSTGGNRLTKVAFGFHNFVAPDGRLLADGTRQQNLEISQQGITEFSRIKFKPKTITISSSDSQPDENHWFTQTAEVVFEDKILSAEVFLTGWLFNDNKAGKVSSMGVKVEKVTWAREVVSVTVAFQLVHKDQGHDTATIQCIANVNVMAQLAQAGLIEEVEKILPQDVSQNYIDGKLIVSWKAGLDNQSYEVKVVDDQDRQNTLDSGTTDSTTYSFNQDNLAQSAESVNLVSAVRALVAGGTPTAYVYVDSPNYCLGQAVINNKPKLNYDPCTGILAGSWTPPVALNPNDPKQYATGYDYQIKGKKTIKGDEAGTTAILIENLDLDSGNYQLKIRAIGQAGVIPGMWSDWQSFTVAETVSQKDLKNAAKKQKKAGNDAWTAFQGLKNQFPGACAGNIYDALVSVGYTISQVSYGLICRDLMNMNQTLTSNALYIAYKGNKSASNHITCAVLLDTITSLYNITDKEAFKADSVLWKWFNQKYDKKTLDKTVQEVFPQVVAINRPTDTSINTNYTNKVVYTPASLDPQLLIRDTLDETSTSVSKGTVSRSPDIIPKMVQTPISVYTKEWGKAFGGREIELGQDNYIYLRFQNTGDTSMFPQITLFYALPGTFVGPENWIYIDRYFADSVLKKGKKQAIEIKWEPGPDVDPGHCCFIAVIETVRNPIFIPDPISNFKEFVRMHKNVAWHNFNFVDNLPDGQTFESKEIYLAPISRKQLKSDIVLYQDKPNQTYPKGTKAILKIGNRIKADKPLNERGKTVLVDNYRFDKYQRQKAILKILFPKPLDKVMRFSLSQDIGGKSFGKFHFEIDQKPQLEIVKATYGSKQKKVDVTKILRKKIKGNKLTIKANNKLAGDPHKGVVKSLFIKYKVGQNVKKVTIDENKTKSIP